MPEAEAVRAVVERTNARVSALYAAGNADEIAAVFAEDCWQMPPHAEPLVGRVALRAFWQQAFQWGQWRFALTTQDLVVAGAIAVERGSYTLSFAAGPAAPPTLPSFEDRGNYLVLWRHEQDDQWRAVWDAPVSAVPLPTPPL
jgi:ketosteroid isomerase-like protein